MTSGESSRDQEGPEIESMHCDLCMQASNLHQMDLNLILIVVIAGLLMTSQTIISVWLFQEYRLSALPD